MLRIDDVFSKEVTDILKSSLIEEPCSTEELAQAMASVERIRQLERTKRKELEAIAERIARDAFPVFRNNELSVVIKAELVEELPHSRAGKRVKFSPELMDEYRKRKLANMITQGAGLGTHGVHHVDDEFRSSNKELVEHYDFIDNINMRSIRTVHDDVIVNMTDRQVASIPPQGIVQLEHISGVWTINAKATIMPVLIHEIIKGMYELLAMCGLPGRALSERTMAYTDTIRDEFMDIKYGGEVYARVRDFIRSNFSEFTDKRPEVLEYWLQEFYQKPAPEMLAMADDIISGRMDPKKLKSTIAAIYGDIERDERDSRIGT